MAYTAIVLDAHSAEKVKRIAKAMGLTLGLDKLICHHVTLAMGDESERFRIGGALRKLSATHYGLTSGRVAAFRVAGASDSDNAIPHVTIAVNSKIGAKPVESNEIVEWVPLLTPFVIMGTVKVCG